MAPYVRFIADNERYIGTIERRIISYWACYYRQAYPDRKTYPASIAFDYLKENFANFPLKLIPAC
jgi:hypothetical protein